MVPPNVEQSPGERQPASAIGIWKQVASFHARNLISLLPILPILLIPVMTDALQTILIDQEEKRGTLSTMTAVQKRCGWLRRCWP
jgi:hypothetical protein